MDESKVDAATIVSAMETHVYLNSRRTITIRQIDPLSDDEESIIVFHPRYANAVIAAIRLAVRDSQE